MSTPTDSMSAEHSTPCIVVDTNVWVAHPLLRTPLAAAFLYTVHRLGAVIGLPEVIEQEVIEHAVATGSEAVDSIDAAFSTVATIIGARDDYHVPTAEEFERAARERLQELDSDIVRVAFSFEHARRALHRVQACTPPNGPKNQQFKDSAIWEALIELAEQYSVHFISMDKAFYEGRTYDRGLAHMLADECRTLERHITIHPGIEPFLKATESQPSVFNTRLLLGKLSVALTPEMSRVATEKGLVIGPLTGHAISAFQTASTALVASQYELSYDAYEAAPEADADSSRGRVVVSGSASYNYQTDELFDVRLGSVAYRVQSSESENTVWQSLYANGSGSIGRGAIP